MTNLSASKVDSFATRLLSVSDHHTRLIFLVTASMMSNHQWNGEHYHQCIQDLFTQEHISEKNIWEWLRDWMACNPNGLASRSNQFSPKLIEDWYRKADQFHHTGICCKRLNIPDPLKKASKSCPTILFCKGTNFNFTQTQWISIFNSRKPRQILPNTPWLCKLRHSLSKIKDTSAGIVSSTGTLTYDLTSLYASKNHIPLVIVLPHPIHEPMEFDCSASSILSCQPVAFCDKKTQMVCRDRLLAFISDRHIILEIRPNGNLDHILCVQQTYDQRIQQKFGHPPTVNETHIFSNRRIEGGAIDIIISDEIVWKDYLFHYTRSCAGPWIGQSYESYLESILANDPLCGHTAADTLIRILMENRIRASGKLIRGQQPVVSFTSVPPLELNRIRKWNPSLIRWTFEPYGIAIHRKYLKSQGCLPVIYGSDKVYEKLKPTDRFRFQKHSAKTRNWRQEKEWRCPHDIDLTNIPPKDVRIIVKESKDVEKFNQFISLRFPVYCLG